MVSALWTAAVPAAYVLPFYLQPGGLSADRNAVPVVWYRACACTLAAAGIVAAIHHSAAACNLSLSSWLGMQSLSAKGLLTTLKLLFAIYAGTLIQLFQRCMSLPYKQAQVHIGLRDLLVGPVLEEVVFRACSMRILLSSRMAPAKVIFVAPLFFGVAHLHHMVQAVMVHKQALSRAAAVQAFQFLYTYLFGAIVGALYMSTGSLALACLLHMGCNWLGVPAVTVTARQRGMMSKVVSLWLAGGVWTVMTIAKLTRGPFTLSACK